jgi:hypothetical protein
MSEHVMRSIVDRHVGEAALLQRQGQNLYGQGNLDGAVRAFTEVNIPVFCHSISCVAAFRNSTSRGDFSDFDTSGTKMS